MTGDLIIDGSWDAYTNAGVMVEDYTELLSWPGLKPLDINDWHEQNGIEPDLSSPKLNTRQLTIKFAFIGENRYFTFINKIASTPVYHTFNFAEIGRTYTLRYVSSDFSEVVNYGRFSITFAEDDHLAGYTYGAPTNSIAQSCGYELDTKDFADFGVMITADTVKSIMNLPTVKENLLVNIDSQSGVYYDDDIIKFKEKNVEIGVFIEASSLLELWKNQKALLYKLIQPNARALYVSDTETTYQCFYKNFTVDKYYLCDRFILTGKLTLTFISFVVGDVEYLLVAENDYLIETEDGTYCIDMSSL